MADINAELLRFNNRIGPQYLDRDDKSGGLDGTMKPTEGSDGALHTKIVDHNGNPISSVNKLQVADADVKAELEAIKAQQAQILQRLDEPIPTELTGSIVELADDDIRRELTAGSAFTLLEPSVREGFKELRMSFRSSAPRDFEVVLESLGESGFQISKQIETYEGGTMIVISFKVYSSRYTLYVQNVDEQDMEIRRYNVIGVR